VQQQRQHVSRSVPVDRAVLRSKIHKSESEKMPEQQQQQQYG